MRSRFARVLAVVLGVVLVYVAWRLAAAPSASGTESPVDTMCIASRIGLPCAPEP